MRSRQTGSMGGGPSGRGSVEERLERRFDQELQRAEREYPRLRLRFLAEGGRRPLRPRSRPRLQAVLVGFTAVSIVALVASGLLLRPSTAPAGPGTSGRVASASATVAEATSSYPRTSDLAGLVLDGLPATMNGEKVYRLWERSNWSLTGSFLLGGYKSEIADPCGAAATPSGSLSAEHKLIVVCGGVALTPLAVGSKFVAAEVAPLGSESLVKMIGNPAVVVRAHLHDPLAAQCSASSRAACDEALVVESVVWSGAGTGSETLVRLFNDGVPGPLTADGLPSAMGDKPVVPFTDPLPTQDWFLLGGRVAQDESGCASAASSTPGSTWPSCGRWSIGGHQMAQTGIDLSSLVGHRVVVRVYDAGSTSSCAGGVPTCRVLAAVQILWAG